MTGPLPGEVTAPQGETAVLVAVQSALGGRPGVLSTARGLSHFGEHSIGWVAAGLIGAAINRRDKPRRRSWLAAGRVPSARTPPRSSSSGWCVVAVRAMRR
ncbi:Probable phosphoesterase [Mycobacteroides abscessus]|nr:Probable phosphoesterase [Mycobacteroides abscessus]